MNIVSLIDCYFRHRNRQYLSFDESAGGTQLPAPLADREYMLYLHIPYCVSLCPFCSFHRFRFREDRVIAYFAALRAEIELVTAAGYRFGQVYVGGGTPTVLPAELVRTLEVLQAAHGIREISVETSPRGLEAGTLRDLEAAGVSRLSVGVQSFDDDLLRQMQRYDSYGSSAQIRERLLAAKGCFDTLNVDMIFNFPDQTETSLHNDLRILVEELELDQVTFYPLMTAKGTRRLIRRTVGTVDYNRERQLYEDIADYMLRSGFSRSSAWCFSRRPGICDEYIAGNEQYLGLGSGAFSYLQGSLYASTFSIEQYRQLVADGRTGTIRRRDLRERERMRYYLLMHLFGGSLDRAAAEDHFDGRFSQVLWPELAALRTIGAVREADGVLTLTEAGCYLWVMLMREFFIGVSNLRDQMRCEIGRHSALQSAN